MKYIAIVVALLLMSCSGDAADTQSGMTDAGESNDSPDSGDSMQPNNTSQNNSNANNSSPNNTSPNNSNQNNSSPNNSNVGDGSGVRLVDGELFVDGEAFFVQGVAWNPVGVGGLHPRDLDYAGFVEQDSDLMQQAGLNVVRTYEAITDTEVLDTLHSRGIYVMNTVYSFGGADPESARAKVEAVADHPAILMWVIGNEWNYNGFYSGLSFDESVARINEVAAIVREVDTSHPIATIYGELPSSETVENMPLIDAWGINAYRGLGFGDLFDRWQQLSDKPMFLGEFGADAWNANSGAEDQAAQAEATVALTGEIRANSTAAGGPCLGGIIFEFADEWWKDGEGSPDVQDVGGVAPGGGPHPDATFNEEWWGLVTIDRTPRQAYRDLPAVW